MADVNNIRVVSVLHRAPVECKLVFIVNSVGCRFNMLMRTRIVSGTEADLLQCEYKYGSRYLIYATCVSYSEEDRDRTLAD